MSGEEKRQGGLIGLLSAALSQEMGGRELAPPQVTRIDGQDLPPTISRLIHWVALIAQGGGRLILASSREEDEAQLEFSAQAAARVLGVESSTSIGSDGDELSEGVGGGDWVLLTTAGPDEEQLVLLLDDEMAGDLKAEIPEEDTSETGAPPHEFEPLTPGNGEALGEGRDLELILDVPLDVTVRLGSARRRIRDILALNSGAVLELDRQAGEAVDILVNGKMLARGEVVIIDDNFGVRITDIVSQTERINRLG